MKTVTSLRTSHVDHMVFKPSSVWPGLLQRTLSPCFYFGEFKNSLVSVFSRLFYVINENRVSFEHVWHRCDSIDLHWDIDERYHQIPAVLSTLSLHRGQIYSYFFLSQRPGRRLTVHSVNLQYLVIDRVVIKALFISDAQLMMHYCFLMSNRGYRVFLCWSRPPQSSKTAKINTHISKWCNHCVFIGIFISPIYESLIMKRSTFVPLWQLLTLIWKPSFFPFLFNFTFDLFMNSYLKCSILHLFMFLLPYVAFYQSVISYIYFKYYFMCI